MKSILHVKFTQSSAMFAAKNVTKKVDKNMSKKEKKIVGLFKMYGRILY